MSDYYNPAIWIQLRRIAFAVMFLGGILIFTGMVTLVSHPAALFQSALNALPVNCTGPSGAPCPPEESQEIQSQIAANQPQVDDGGGRGLLDAGKFLLVGGAIGLLIASVFGPRTGYRNYFRTYPRMQPPGPNF